MKKSKFTKKGENASKIKKVKKKIAVTQGENLTTVNLNAAGIDVGSKSHFVAIGQRAEDVREFGVYTEDLHSLCQWLKDKGITSVALESTGTYWQNLFLMLQDYGLNPILVNGKFTKHVQGRKSDVMDCQWIQRLHSFGLLPNSYQPSTFTEKLRQYTRHRQGVLDNAADYIRKMQKALRQMNLRLDVAIADVTGQTGRAIIEAIIGGESDPVKLADLANYRIHKSKEELAQALTGVFKEEFIFELRQSYQIYNFFRTQIAQCDQAIEKCLLTQIEANEKVDGEIRPKYNNKTRKKVNKNSPKIDTQKLAFQLTGGIDLSAIDGVSSMTILSLVSEIDLDMSAFKTAKQFASWLRLAPNNKISGGKTLSSHTPKNKNPLALALQRAAYAIGNNLKDGALHQFYHRIKYKKGDLKATTATARKLAVIIWNMLTKKEQYRPLDTQVYKDKIRQNVLNNLNKKMKAFKIRPDEINFATI
jgi:transposase